MCTLKRARGHLWVLLTVTRSKGLEFDTVLLVDPELIRAGSPRGVSDLYVALTRATRHLIVLRPAPRG